MHFTAIAFVAIFLSTGTHKGNHNLSILLCFVEHLIFPYCFLLCVQVKLFYNYQLLLDVLTSITIFDPHESKINQLNCRYLHCDQRAAFSSKLSLSTLVIQCYLKEPY